MKKFLVPLFLGSMLTVNAQGLANRAYVIVEPDALFQFLARNPAIMTDISAYYATTGFSKVESLAVKEFDVYFRDGHPGNGDHDYECEANVLVKFRGNGTLETRAKRYGKCDWP